MYGEILIHTSVVSSTIISNFLNDERLFDESHFYGRSLIEPEWSK